MAAVLTAFGAGCHGGSQALASDPLPAGSERRLPSPRPTGSVSLEQAIGQRRSQREFAPGPLSDEQLSQLLWAAGGITDAAHGLRAAPSAGALYPLELYAVDAAGVWHYEPAAHRLRLRAGGDRRGALARAALGQGPVGAAALDVVITAVLARTAAKYGGRAERFAQLEAGHAAQNALLEATSLGLSSVPVGAFDDDEIRGVLGASRDETPLYVLCFGLPPRSPSAP